MNTRRRRPALPSSPEGVRIHHAIAHILPIGLAVWLLIGFGIYALAEATA